MQTQFSTLAILFGTIILYSACHEKVELDNGISIEGLPNDTTIVESSILSFDIMVTAADGLSQLKVNDNFVEVKGLKSYTTNYFIIGSLDSYYKRNEEDEVIVSIFAKDLDGDVLNRQLTLNVVSEIKFTEPPIEEADPLDYIVIDKDITESQVWESGKAYLLKGRIVVLPGQL